jgi:hypothetical protein
MSEPEKKSSFKPDVRFWVVALCVITFLAAIMFSHVIPQIALRRPSQPANACINNLRQIDAAAQEFALEKGKTNGETIHYPDDLTPFIKLDKNGKIPTCPKGGVYSIKKVGDIPTCSLGTNITPPHVMP